MAPISASSGRIQLHADPGPCRDFFSSLKYNFHHSQASGLDTFPTKDKLSWAIQKCPNGIEGIAKVLGLTKNELETEMKAGFGIGPRQLIAFPDHNQADPLPTEPSTAETSYNDGISTGIIIAIVVALCIILLIVQHVRRVQFRRQVERSARLTRKLKDQGAGRAQAKVKAEWDAIDKKNADRLEDWRMQELAKAASETLAPPAEVYKNPRKDWNQTWI